MTSGAQHVLTLVVVESLNALLVGSCVYAIVKGRPAERLGGLLYLISFLFDTVIALVNGKFVGMVPVLMFDAAVAVGFLVLAIRYNNLWLGAVMMLKGVQLAFHATHLTDETDMHIGALNIYVLGVNATCIMIALTLIMATRSSVRARRSRQQAVKENLGASSTA